MELNEKDLRNNDTILEEAIINDKDLKGFNSVLVLDFIKQIKSGAIDIKILEDIVFKTDADLKILDSLVKPEMLSDLKFLETIMIKSETVEGFNRFLGYYLMEANVYEIMGLLKKIYDLNLTSALNSTKFLSVAILNVSAISNITFLDMLVVRSYAYNLLGSEYPDLKELLAERYNTLLSIHHKSSEEDCKAIYQKYLSESKNQDVPKSLRNLILTSALDVLNQVKDTELYSVVTNELRSLTFRDIEKDMNLINKIKLLIQYQPSLNSNLARSIN